MISRKSAKYDLIITRNEVGINVSAVSNNSNATIVIVHKLFGAYNRPLAHIPIASLIDRMQVIII